MDIKYATDGNGMYSSFSDKMGMPEGFSEITQKEYDDALAKIKKDSRKAIQKIRSNNHKGIVRKYENGDFGNISEDAIEMIFGVSIKKST